MYSSPEITTGFAQLRLRREAKIFITCHIQVFDIVFVEQIIDTAAQAQRWSNGIIDILGEHAEACAWAHIFSGDIALLIGYAGLCADQTPQQAGIPVVAGITESQP